MGNNRGMSEVQGKSTGDGTPKENVELGRFDGLKAKTKELKGALAFALPSSALLTAAGWLATTKLDIYRVASLPEMLLAGGLGVVATMIGTQIAHQREHRPKSTEKNEKKPNEVKRDQLKVGAVVVGTLMARSLIAMLGLGDIPELWNARTEPKKRFFEKLDENEHDLIIRSKLDYLANTSLSTQDRVALKKVLATDNATYDNFKIFVKFFGENYFANNPEYGPDYRTFLEQNFLPKLFGVFEDKDVDILTFLTMCGYAGAVTGGDYGLDISQDKKRVAFNHLRDQELKNTGSDILARHLKFYAYPSLNLYGSVMGPRDGIRVGETSASLAMHDQEIEVYFAALAKYWRELPDQYQSVANTALNVNNLVQTIEKERSAIGMRIFDYCHGMGDNDPIMAAMKGSHLDGVEKYEEFWDSVGLGVGINDISKLKNERLIVEQETHPTQVWKAMTDLVYGGERDSEFIGKLYDETNESFAVARKVLLSQMDEQGHDPRDNVYWLIKDQMFRKDFRDYVLANAGDRADEWQKIMEEWDTHVETVNTKNALTEIAYQQMGSLEYDVDFQMWLNRGITEYYVDKINAIPVLNEYVKSDPLAQMVIAMSIRELAPTDVWINDRNGPIAPNGAITPLNVDAMLNIWGSAITVMKERMAD